MKARIAALLVVSAFVSCACRLGAWAAPAAPSEGHSCCPAKRPVHPAPALSRCCPPAVAVATVRLDRPASAVSAHLVDAGDPSAIESAPFSPPERSTPKLDLSWAPISARPPPAA